MGNVTVNISFQDGLLREIDRVARSEGRSRSELLREAARAYIERRQRWAQLLATGHEIARRKRLEPADVAEEIDAFRRARASRG